MKAKRKSIPKKIREELYLKYSGHCAYCGCVLSYKEMQVDHIKPFISIKWGTATEEEINSLSNLICTCRMCNYYKRCKSLSTFKRELGKLTERLNKIFIFRLAKKYGLIEETGKKIDFYFEK